MPGQGRSQLSPAPCVKAERLEVSRKPGHSSHAAGAPRGQIWDSLSTQMNINC